MTQDELIAAIETMSVLELSQLVKALEVKFGVSAAAPMMMAGAMPAAAAAAAPEPVEEQTEFDVILESFGANKIQRHQGRALVDQPRAEGSQGSGRERTGSRDAGCFQGRGCGRQGQA